MACGFPLLSQATPSDRLEVTPQYSLSHEVAPPCLEGGILGFWGPTRRRRMFCVAGALQEVARPEGPVIVNVARLHFDGSVLCGCGSTVKKGRGWCCGGPGRGLMAHPPRSPLSVPTHHPHLPPQQLFIFLEIFETHPYGLVYAINLLYKACFTN